MDRKNIKAQPLNGKNNIRLKETTPVNNEHTAAWADVDNIMPESQVTQPSLEDVINAKEWVDNGSKL